MTTAELRSALITALGATLGVYNLPGGSTLPAMLIGSQLVDGLTVTGLECIIFRTPAMDRRFEFGEDDAVSKEWTIQLRQWDDTKSMETPIKRVLKAFPRAQGPTLLSGGDVVPQASFSLPDEDTFTTAADPAPPSP